MNIIVQNFNAEAMNEIEYVVDKIIENHIKNKHVVAVVDTSQKNKTKLIEMIAPLQMIEGREADLFYASGVQIEAARVVALLRKKGYKAIAFTGWQAGIETNHQFTKAQLVALKTNHMKDWLKSGTIVVVAANQGITEELDISTLGEGGADTTAIALAASLRAEKCICFSKNGGLFTAPPMILNTRKLSFVTYDEFLELGETSLIHPRAIEFAKMYEVLVEVRSLYKQTMGTIIGEESHLEKNLLVRSITFTDNVTKITLEGKKQKQLNVAVVFSILAEVGINVDIIIQNTYEIEHSIVSFSIDSKDVEKAKQVLIKKKEVLQYNSMEVENDLAKVSIVGSGMIFYPGVAAKMFQTLTEKNIAIKMISTSEIKISTVIPRKDMIHAVEVLHESFELNIEDKAVEL